MFAAERILTIMITHISTCKLIFGKGNAPSLPDGWTLHESDEDWMRATDQNGQKYFLSGDFAYPLRVATKGMPVAEGDGYIDLEAGICLSSNTH